MNKILIKISVIVLLFIPGIFSCTYASNKTQSAEISKIENDIYGFDYINDELSDRLSRLEKSIYGKPSTGDIGTRIKRLGI